MPRPAECCVICLAALLDKHCRGLEMITYARGQFSFHCYSARRKEESKERFTLPWWFYLKCNFMYFWWQGNCFSSCLQSSWTVSHPPWASSKMPCTYIFKCFKWDIYIYIYARVKKSSIYITCRESILFWLRADCSLPPSIWGWADPTLCPFPHYNGLYVHTDVHTQIYTWHFCKISTFNCFKFQICTY